MARISKSELTWNASRRRVFQEMEMPYKKWHEVISDAKNSLFKRYAAQSVTRMRPLEFAIAFGDKFKQCWPEMRREILNDESNGNAVQCGIAGIDAVWGKMVMNDSLAKVPAPGYKITRNDVKIFKLISSSGSGMTAYEISKKIGRDYRRVHDNFERLIKAEVLGSKVVNENGRRKVIAYVM